MNADIYKLNIDKQYYQLFVNICIKLYNQYLYDFELKPGIMLISNNNDIFIIYEMNSICSVKYIDGMLDISQALSKYKYIGDLYPYPISKNGNINELEQYLLFNKLSKIFIDKDNINYSIIDNCLVDRQYNIVQGTLNSTCITNTYSQAILPRAFFALDIHNIQILSNSILSIQHHAFYNCFKLKTVVLSDSIMNIDDECFNQCISLTDINIPINLTKINENVFRYCQSLQQLTIGQNVLEISKSFSYCINLKQINDVNVNCKISPLAFFKCVNTEQDIIQYGNVK